MENNKTGKLTPEEQADHDEAVRIRKRASRSLDRYFEGWQVREVLSASGNVRSERVYVGDYYTTAETKRARILRKIAYVLLFAAALALFVLAAVQPTGANRMGFAGLTQGVTLLAMIWVLNGLFSYVTAPKEMTVSDYKSGVLALKKSSFYMMLSFALPALATLIHLIADPVQWKTELLCTLSYLAAGAVTAVLQFSEKRLVYMTRPSPERLHVSE